MPYLTQVPGFTFTFYKNRQRNAGVIIENISGCFFLNTVYIAYIRRRKRRRNTAAAAAAAVFFH